MPGVIKFFGIIFLFYFLVDAFLEYEKKEYSVEIIDVNRACFLRSKTTKAKIAFFLVDGVEKKFYFDDRYLKYNPWLKGCYRLRYFVGAFGDLKLISLEGIESE